jgi:hypothetical protein
LLWRKKGLAGLLVENLVGGIDYLYDLRCSDRKIAIRRNPNQSAIGYIGNALEVEVESGADG